MDDKTSIHVKIESEDFIVNENCTYSFLSEAIQRKHDKQAISNTKQSRKQNFSKQEESVKHFECNKCKKLCLTKKDMITHWKNHDKEIYKCTKCDRAFVSKNSLSYHMKSHAGIKYECDICKRQFNDKSNMKKHKNIHLNIKPYKCKKCLKAFSDPTSFKSHMEQHAGVRFKCKFCATTYAGRQSLKRHLICHLKGDSKLFSCYQCKDISFTHKYQLEEHQNKHHLNIQYNCYHCPKVFFHKVLMRCHLKTHSSRFTCSHKGCGKHFPTYACFKNHNEAWHENNFLHCNECSKMFRSKEFLKQHQRRVHSKFKPHVCNICGISFYKKTELHYHNQSIHENIVYQCSQCLHKCSNKRALNCHIKRRHLKTSMGSKNKIEFECAICTRKFLSKENLKNHLMAEHMKTTLLHCELCDYSSYTRKVVQHHTINHPNMKYHCKHCTEKFSEVELFRLHLSNHLVKPLQCNDHKWKEHVAKFEELYSFKCNSCTARFILLDTLKKHIITVHSEAQFQCEWCEKTYTLSRSLKRHVEVVHSGNTYQCNKCLRYFSSKGGIWTHVHKGRCFKKEA